MNYRGHTFIGILSLFIFLPFLNLFYSVSIFNIEISYIVAFTVLGALIPDIDTPHSNISTVAQSFLLVIGITYFIIKRFLFHEPLTMNTIIAITIIFPLISFIFTGFVSSAFGHRTITHSILMFFILLLGGILLSYKKILNPIYVSSFLWGFLTHIYADGTTKMGVAYFYPFNKDFYHSISTEKNKQEDNIFQVILLLSISIFFIFSIIYFIASGFKIYDLSNTSTDLAIQFRYIKEFMVEFFNPSSIF